MTRILHFNGQQIKDKEFFQIANLFHGIIVGDSKAPVLPRPCFDITEYCPLACQYCYANSGPWMQKKNMPLSDIEYYTDAFQDHPAFKVIELSGGEPFSAPTPYLEKVFEYSAKYNNYIDVHTNGYFLKSPKKTSKIIEILKKYPHNKNNSAAIQLSISSDSEHKTDYEKKFNFAMQIINDPELGNKVYPILFVYEKCIADYFKLMQSRKKELDIKVVGRRHHKILGNNELTFESNGNPFGICDCNFIKVSDNGFSPNDGTWPVFEQPLYGLAFALRNLLNNSIRGGYKSLGLTFWPDETAGLLVDLIPAGRVPYKDNGKNKSINRLLEDISLKLAFEATDEGSQKLQNLMKERFNKAQTQRDLFYKSK